MENIEQSAETTEPVNTEVGASEVADTSNDVEFSDTPNEDVNKADDGKQEPQTPSTPKESENKENKPQKTNSDYARERRKAEREAEIKKVRNEAIIETLGGENPYTHEKMEDEADVQEYLTMKEIEKSGKDPIADYSKYLKQRAKEQAKITQTETSRQEWIKNDKQNFETKYPDVKLNDLIDNEQFRLFASGKVGVMTMTKIYEDYQSFITRNEESAKEKVAQILANNAATPGQLTTSKETPPKDINKMTKAEFDNLVERVKRGEKVN
jgi:hypothetical protein